MSQNRKGLGEIITGLTIAVLFIVILSLVVFAARGYQHSVELQDGNGNIRAVVSYIANSVRDNSEGNVSIEQRSGTECLIISSDEGYEQRFYLHEGQLMEEYCEADSPNRPDVAIKIGDTGTFALNLKDNGVLEISTDEGTSYVNTNRH